MKPRMEPVPAENKRFFRFPFFCFVARGGIGSRIFEPRELICNFNVDAVFGKLQIGLHLTDAWLANRSGAEKLVMLVVN